MHFRHPCALVALLVLAPFAPAQQESQFYNAPILVVPSKYQRMNALLDFNGDGWMDAVGSYSPNSDKAGVYGFLNDGRGSLDPLFKFEWPISDTKDLPFPIEAADLDDDGRDDFVAGLRGVMRIYRSTGAAPATLAFLVPMGGDAEVRDLTIGDYDGDGELEVAVRLYQGASDRGLAIYDGVTTAPTSTWFAQPPFGTGMVLRNVQADSDAALELMCVGANHVDLYDVEGDNLVSVATLAHGLQNVIGGAAGDLDGDGDEDIAVFSKDGVYTILRRTGPSAFAVESPQTGGPATDLADVDLDGDLDGVCCGGTTDPDLTSWNPNTNPSFFEIAINDGSGAFADSFPLLGVGANAIAGVTDIDHDGDQDLIAGRAIQYNVDGFEPTNYPETVNAVLPGSLHDLDGDGDADVADSGDVALCDRNRADGILEPDVRIVPTPVTGIVYDKPGLHGDVDGDGDVDTIVNEIQWETYLGSRVLINTGGGGFVQGGYASHVWEDISPENGFFGDVTGDGRPDLILRDDAWLQESTQLWIQQPGGSFLPSTTMIGEFAHDVGDLDGDGHVDIGLVDTDSIVLRFGSPSGSLSEVLDFPTVGSFVVTSQVKFGDLDGDGDLDVVGPTDGGTHNTLRVLENLGNREFQVRDGLFDYQGSGYPLHLVDVNQDGALDVAVGYRLEAPNTVAEGLSHFLGSSSDPFTFVDAGDPTWPVFTVMGDLDGDGDPDGMADGLGALNIAKKSPEAAYRLQYGSGTPGLGGEVPTLGAHGPAVDQGPLTVSITGTAPNATGFLLLGTGTDAFPLADTGGLLEIFPTFALLPLAFPSTEGTFGSGKLEFTVWLPDGLAGFTLTQQAVIVDPAASGGAALSNALLLTIGEG